MKHLYLGLGMTVVLLHNGTVSYLSLRKTLERYVENTSGRQWTGESTPIHEAVCLGSMYIVKQS